MFGFVGRAEHEHVVDMQRVKNIFARTTIVTLSASRSELRLEGFMQVLWEGGAGVECETQYINQTVSQ